MSGTNIITTVGHIEFSPQTFGDTINHRVPKQKKVMTADQLKADKQRPSSAQKDERTKLIDAVRKALVDFTDATGLIVEYIDIDGECVNSMVPEYAGLTVTARLPE